MYDIENYYNAETIKEAVTLKGLFIESFSKKSQINFPIKYSSRRTGSYSGCCPAKEHYPFHGRI